MAKTVIGTFDSRDQAERAVNTMRDKGFAENEVSILARDQGAGQQGRQGGGAGVDDPSEGVGWGAGLGAGAGLLASAGALAIPGIGPLVAVGPLAATLSGAVTGGIAGGLLDWGIPEERGQHFEEEVKQGRVLCVIKTDEQKAAEAARLMRDSGAEDVESHQAGS